tara:strand:+ start:150 stop:719 length:570 start_codon:yes stop_codon:yes gene_type:complete
MIQFVIKNKSYPAPLTTKQMHYVANRWKKNAQQMLRRQGHNATGELTRSIKVSKKINQDADDWSIELTPQVNYWKFVDWGVSGKEKKYTRESFDLINSDTKNFSYTNKKPPLSAIMGWLKTKGYQGRNQKGQFITDRSFGFIVQKAIFQRGLKPSYFISKTGNNILKKYSQSIGDAVAQDIANITMQLI